MFESWAMNTPFVTSDVGDRRTLAGTPPAILLSDPGNPADLAEKIIALLQNTRYQKLMSKLGYERVQEYYWRNILHRSLMIFKRFEI